MITNKSQIIIYKTPAGETKLGVRFDGDTVWLTQDQIAKLFDKGRSTITEHIQSIFDEQELDPKSVCRDFRRTGTDGKQYSVKHYNLELIISVGYRVKSLRGTQFRIWATQQLKELKMSNHSRVYKLMVNQSYFFVIPTVVEESSNLDLSTLLEMTRESRLSYFTRF